MKAVVERVVFDCNVYFQALTSPLGPAARLLELASHGEILLYVSNQTLEELSDVASRPHIAVKYGLDAAVVDTFITDVKAIAVFVDDVPHIFDFPRDPDDAHYIDLAVAAAAKLIVSRDKDLLSLSDTSTMEGNEFVKRFPNLLILTPPQALRLIEGTATGSE